MEIMHKRDEYRTFVVLTCEQGVDFISTVHVLTAQDDCGYIKINGLTV